MKLILRSRQIQLFISLNEVFFTSLFSKHCILIRTIEFFCGDMLRNDGKGKKSS